MIFDQKEVEKEIKKAKTGALVFFIISMCLFGLAIGLIITSIIIGTKSSDAWFVYGYSAGICMSLGFTFLILRSVFFMSKIKFILFTQEQEKAIKEAQASQVVDAKPVDSLKEESTRENKLYQQYENLYKQGYITEEELEQKRKGLLGE